MGKVLVGNVKGPAGTTNPFDVVAVFDADPTGAVGASAAFNNARLALPSSGGAIYVPAGTYLINSTVGPFVTGQWIDCEPGVQFIFTGTGDCFNFTDSSTYTTRTQQGGGIQGRPRITKTGSAAGARAIHAGDILGLRFDIAIQDFNGTTDIGAYFDNRIYWAEQAVCSIWTDNCTQDLVFDCTGATTSAGSFDRGKFTVYLSHKTFIGDCITFQNGAYIIGGELNVFGNIASSASTFTHSILKLTGSAPAGHPSGASLLDQIALNINLESDGAQAHTFQTVNYGSIANVITRASGNVSFGPGNQFTQSNITTVTTQFGFIGPVAGDTSLNENVLTGRLAVSSSASFFSNQYVAGISASPGTPTGGFYIYSDLNGVMHLVTPGGVDTIVGPGIAADPTGSVDCAPLLTAAIAALPANGGTIHLGPGTFKVNSTVTMLDKQVYIRGAGRWVTTLKFTGTGDCLRITSLATLSAPVSGGIFDLTIDGTSAGAGSTGLHLGETRAFELDLAIQNFSGAGSMGMHFDNQYAWTEETHGYLWLSNNTQNLVFDVSAPANITVAAGSNGGTISGIATWGSSFGGNGTLVVSSTALFPASGTITVAASGSTTAIVTYTGKTSTTLTGCAYVSGSASGTVATGGAVGLVTADNSFGYSDLSVEILAKDNQDGLVCQNGAIVYNSKLRVRANFRSIAATNTSAAIRLTGTMPANHPHSNASGIQNCDFTYVAECGTGSGSNAPQTIAFGSLTGGTQNNLIGCVGILAFTYGAQGFAQTNYTSGGAAGAFSFMGLVQGDFNLNPATTFLGQAVTYFIGAPISYARSLFNTVNGNLLIDRGDFFSIVLAQNTTLSLTGGGSALGTAQRKTIYINQPASGGPYTMTFPHQTSGITTANPTINWAGGSAPTLTARASALDVIELTTYDGSVWHGIAYLDVK